jgi:methylated-DNA-[protein]-cysteine S-methyltransferase
MVQKQNAPGDSGSKKNARPAKCRARAVWDAGSIWRRIARCAFFVLCCHPSSLSGAAPPSRHHEPIPSGRSVRRHPACAVRRDRHPHRSRRAARAGLPAKHFAAKAPADALAEITAAQIERYIADPDFIFSTPLPQVGSEFQRKVLRAISSIPRGEVRTYGAIARAIGSAPRAVGQACGANWFPLLIPCHRVTAAGGLGGFAHHDDETGFHLGVKRWLLAHEGVEAYR